MELQGQFYLMGNGSVTEQTRKEFEADGLRPPTGGIGSATGGPIQDVVSAWFYLESHSPGVAGAVAAQAVTAVTYVVHRMTKWFRAGESIAPEARNHVVVTLGAATDPHHHDVKIELGPDYSGDDIAKIVRAAVGSPDEQ